RAADSSRPHTLSRGSADRLPLLEGSGFAAPAVVPLWAFSLLARLRNVLPQDSCVKTRPRGAHEEDGHRLLAASEAVRGAGGGRWTVWWQRAPTPLVRRCAPRVGRAVLHWPGCVPRIGTPWKASHGRGALAGGRRSEAAPLACLWPLRFFLLEGDARYAALAPAS